MVWFVWFVGQGPFPSFGLDPTTGAGEPRMRIVHVVEEECRVFRTKARAPSLMVLIVQPDHHQSDTEEDLMVSKGQRTDYQCDANMDFRIFGFSDFFLV